MFCSDYPRGVINCLWLWWFPAFDALAVAPALTVPFLLARRRLPISPLGFPTRPSPRPFPALLTAIPLTPLPWTKPLLTAFEQTPAHPRQADSSLSSARKNLHNNNGRSRLTNRHS